MRHTITTLVLLAGCVSSGNFWVNYTPVSGTTTQARADVVQKVVVAITDAGHEVESSDAATGIVLSKWFPGFDAKFRIRATVGSDGHYELTALCQQSDGSDCSSDKRPRNVVEALAKIDASLH